MYKVKLSPEEALETIKLRMKYDSSKTLTENVGIIKEQVDIGGDIKDIKDELDAAFNTDEESIVNIFKKYKNKSDFNKLLSSYKEKYGKDLGDAMGIPFSQYSDQKEWADLKNHLATLGVELGSETFNGGNDVRATFKGVDTKVEDTATKTDTTTKTDTATKTVVGNTVPAELKDVKAFQTWLDKNKPGWHDKYNTLGTDPAKGYGKFGPRTSKAWSTYKDEYLKGTNTPTVTPTPTGNPDLEVDDKDASFDQPF